MPVDASSGTAASSGEGYAVQVTSERSAADAEMIFRSLQAKFPNQLGGREPIVRRTDLGPEGIYFVPSSVLLCHKRRRPECAVRSKLQARAVSSRKTERWRSSPLRAENSRGGIPIVNAVLNQRKNRAWIRHASGTRLHLFGKNRIGRPGPDQITSLAGRIIGVSQCVGKVIGVRE